MKQVVLSFLIAVTAPGCAHPLVSPREQHSRQVGLTAPEASPFDFTKADEAACRTYDTAYVICASLAPALALLASGAAALPAAAPQMEDRTKNALLLTSTFSAALAAGAGACSQTSAARYADRCTTSRSVPP